MIFLKKKKESKYAYAEVLLFLCWGFFNFFFSWFLSHLYDPRDLIYVSSLYI